MAIISEDGTGVAGAEVYGTVTEINAYWASRSHDEFAATWNALSTEAKEGCARAATAWLDAYFGLKYRGQRKSYDQGLEWPRFGGLDDDGLEIALTDLNGVELPVMPQQLKTAVAELVKDINEDKLAQESRQPLIKSTTVDDVSTVFADGASITVSVTNRIGMLLGPVLSSPGGGSWDWR